MSDYLHKSHDEFFKASFGRLEIARDYLEQLLPQDVQQSVELSQPERVNGSWVTPELEEYFSDVVYRCPLKERSRPVWVSLLFEHKSSPDAFVHLQLLHYLLILKHIWEPQFILEHPDLIFIHLSNQNHAESEFILSLLVYFFKNTEIARETANRFIQQLPIDLNQNVMSTYDMIKAEGIEEGIEQGIEQGIGLGIEQGADLKEREIIKNLWSLQEFSLEKIALLAGTSQERVLEVLGAHLQAEGLNEVAAMYTLEVYQARFLAS